MSPGPGNFSQRPFEKCFWTGRQQISHCHQYSKKEAETLRKIYGPVSFASQMTKVMESIVRDEIVRHLDNLFRDSQHGFRHGRSYTSNLLEILDIVTEQVNQKGIPGCADKKQILTDEVAVHKNAVQELDPEVKPLTFWFASRERFPHLSLQFVIF